MRFMIIVKSNPSTEAGKQPTDAQLAAMLKYNEELVKAGVMLAGEGLHPTSKGAKVKFEGKRRTVVDGPFTEAKELIAGFWLWQCRDKAEAIEWLKRAPMEDGDEIELRQVFEAADFSEASPETLQKEAELRARVDASRA